MKINSPSSLVDLQMQVTREYLAKQIRETSAQLAQKEVAHANMLPNAADALIELVCAQHYAEFLTTYLYDQMLSLEKPE